jgi:hypothetical protein
MSKKNARALGAMRNTMLKLLRRLCYSGAFVLRVRKLWSD